MNCLLDTEKKISILSRELVKAWGDNSLSLIDLEERISTAAEKAPTDDQQITSLRDVIGQVKDEFEVVVSQEELLVRTLEDCMLLVLSAMSHVELIIN